MIEYIQYVYMYALNFSLITFHFCYLVLCFAEILRIKDLFITKKKRTKNLGWFFLFLPVYTHFNYHFHFLFFIFLTLILFWFFVYFSYLISSPPLSCCLTQPPPPPPFSPFPASPLHTIPLALSLSRSVSPMEF